MIASDTIGKAVRPHAAVFGDPPKIFVKENIVPHQSTAMAT